MGNFVLLEKTPSNKGGEQNAASVPDHFQIIMVNFINKLNH